LTSEDAVTFEVFDSAKGEVEWLARSIKANLKDEELEHDDILIVIPEALAIRSAAGRIMEGLRAGGINTHLAGVTTSRDEVFAPNSVAITSVYRAKGNEAPMVYVVGAEYCQGGFNLARKRNILFTAITRSRAWVRVSGVGLRMADLAAEYQRIVRQDYDLRFQYPTTGDLKKLRILHRDRSADEITEIQRDLDGLSRLLARVESGEVSIDALPLEAQTLVKRLSNETSKSSKPSRKAN
jgi:superfamily I DNA and RNA helicase